MSSGAAVAGALHIAEKMTSGTIVVILPDRGDRYLSTTLFRSMSLYYGLNAHKWATKMEVRRLLSGKPDLELKADHKKTQ